MSKPKLVVSTGAGISAESGLATFRDKSGLWTKYDVEDVASHDGLMRNPALVHTFFNSLRKDVAEAEPNRAHRILAELEKHYDVYVITQNVDNLHERAGSSRVLHLHGRIDMVESTSQPGKYFVLENPDAATTVDTVIDGHHIRPHIVLFGEAVPNFEPATELVHQADIFVIVGTSLQVYPAASLVHYVRPGVPVFYVDPNPAVSLPGVTVIAKPATEGMAELADLLTRNLPSSDND